MTADSGNESATADDLYDEIRHKVGKMLNEYDEDRLCERPMTVKEAVIMGVADAQNGMYWRLVEDE